MFGPQMKMPGKGPAGGTRRAEPAWVKAGGMPLRRYMELGVELRTRLGQWPADRSWAGIPGMPDVMRRLDVLRGAAGLRPDEHGALENAWNRWLQDVAHSRTPEGVAELVKAGVCKRVKPGSSRLAAPDPAGIRHVVSHLSAAAKAQAGLGAAVIDQLLGPVRVEVEPDVRTIASIGGWYAVVGGGCACGACVEGGVAWEEAEGRSGVLLVSGRRPHQELVDAGIEGPDAPMVLGVEGEDAIACVLGYDDVVDLRRWAAQNPETWGNEYGDLMFELDVAYGVAGADPLAIEDVARHWLGVAERVEAGRGRKRKGVDGKFPSRRLAQVRGHDGSRAALGTWAREGGWVAVDLGMSA